MGQGCSSDTGVRAGGKVDLAREYTAARGISPRSPRSPRGLRDSSERAGRPRSVSSPAFASPRDSQGSGWPGARTSGRMSLDPVTHQPVRPGSPSSSGAPAELDPRRSGGVSGWAERSPRSPGRANALTPLENRPASALPPDALPEPKPLLPMPDHSRKTSLDAPPSPSAAAHAHSPGSARRVAVANSKLAQLQERMANAPPHVRATFNHSTRVIQKAYRQFRMRRVLAMTMVERQRQAAIRDQAAENSGLSAIAAGRRKSFAQF